MQLSHTLRATSAIFDERNLVSAAGLVPVLGLAHDAGLHDLADAHLSIPGKGSANSARGAHRLVADAPGHSQIDAFSGSARERAAAVFRRALSADGAGADGRPCCGREG